MRRANETESREPSSAELFQIWCDLQARYFPEQPVLRGYTVRWSKRRQKRVLATCNIRRCLVSVAKELRYPDHAGWLEPLLYHEMCHAVLEPRKLRHKGRTRWHGPEFRALERRHPQIADLDRWIAEGGWRSAVKQARSRQAAAERRAVRQGRAESDSDLRKIAAKESHGQLHG